MSSGHLKLLAICVLLTTAFHRPLAIWSANAWEITVPVELLIAGLGTFAIAWMLWMVIKRVLRTDTVAALASGTTVLILLYWYLVPWLHPLGWLLLLGVAAVVLDRHVTSQVGTLVAVGFVVAMGAGAILQLGIEHATRAAPYPVTRAELPAEAVPTGAVEDVVVIIPDSYPALVVAESRFDHGAEDLLAAMSRADFVVSAAGLTRHTFTGLSIPSILELQTVVDAGSTGAWRNRGSVYSIIRGDSFTHHALRMAGFQLIHVEGGWNGSKCGGLIDMCIRSSWLDESVWHLLSPSILRGPLLERYGSYTVSGSVGATRHILELLPTVQGDGRHDFVFAHLMLPHPPALVNGDCSVRGKLGGGDMISVEADTQPGGHFSEQLACVDELLAPIVDAIGPGTAVLIAADHGTGAGSQVFAPASEWSEADIAERFGILLSFRMPSNCGEPVDTTSVDVMRAIIKCAVVVDLPDRSTEFLIGAQEVEAVPTDIMRAVRERMSIPQP